MTIVAARLFGAGWSASGCPRRRQRASSIARTEPRKHQAARPGQLQSLPRRETRPEHRCPRSPSGASWQGVVVRAHHSKGSSARKGRDRRGADGGGSGDPHCVSEINSCSSSIDAGATRVPVRRSCVCARTRGGDPGALPALRGVEVARRSVLPRAGRGERRGACGVGPRVSSVLCVAGGCGDPAALSRPGVATNRGVSRDRTRNSGSAAKTLRRRARR